MLAQAQVSSCLQSLLMGSLSVSEDLQVPILPLFAVRYVIKNAGKRMVVDKVILCRHNVYVCVLK